MYNLPGFRQLIELLHWTLVTLHDWFASIGFTEHWTWGLAIIGLTIIVRLIIFPLTWKQFASAQRLQALQPKIKELQQKYKSDRGKLQEETMKLYSEYKVNPFASCLPLLLQLPIFIGLYAAISGKASYLDQASVEALKNASFLWLPHLGEPDPYHILLVVYVASQLVSTELMLTPQTDKQQKYMMRAMPIVFVFMLYRFPAGLFVYWVTTNLWTIGQQLVIRRMMKPVDVEQMAKQPAKKSRFMDSMLEAQNQRMKQREELMAAKEPGGKTPGKQQAGGKPSGKQPAAGKPGAGKAAGKQGGARSGGKAGSKPGGAKKGGARGGGQRPPGKGGKKQGR